MEGRARSAGPVVVRGCDRLEFDGHDLTCLHELGVVVAGTRSSTVSG